MSGGNVGSVAPLTTTFATFATLTGGVKKGPMMGILRSSGVCWKAYRSHSYIISNFVISLLHEMYQLDDKLYHLERCPHSPERYLQRPDWAGSVYITWPENYPCKRVFKSHLVDGRVVSCLVCKERIMDLPDPIIHIWKDEILIH